MTELIITWYSLFWAFIGFACLVLDDNELKLKWFLTSLLFWPFFLLIMVSFLISENLSKYMNTVIWRRK